MFSSRQEEHATAEGLPESPNLLWWDPRKPEEPRQGAVSGPSPWKPHLAPAAAYWSKEVPL